MKLAGNGYQNQVRLLYSFQRTDSDTEDHAFLLFYYPKEVSEDGKVIFDDISKER